MKLFKIILGSVLFLTVFLTVMYEQALSQKQLRGDCFDTAQIIKRYKTDYSYKVVELTEREIHEIGKFRERTNDIVSPAELKHIVWYQKFRKNYCLDSINSEFCEKYGEEFAMPIILENEKFSDSLGLRTAASEIIFKTLYKGKY